MSNELEDPPERSTSNEGCCCTGLRGVSSVVASLIAIGVEFQDPRTTYIGPDVRVDSGAWIGAGVQISGASNIGDGAKVGPNSIIEDSKVGSEAEVGAFSFITNRSELMPFALVKPRTDINASDIDSHAEIGPNAIVESSVVAARAKVGPFCRVRANSTIDQEAYIGTQAEIKASHIGIGSKVGHFSFVGDAVLGCRVNIGAGVVTANFDGDGVRSTYIDADASIGAGTMLIAPLRIGAKARTGSGAVVTRDVPEGALVAGVPARAMLRCAGDEAKEHIDHLPV